MVPRQRPEERLLYEGRLRRGMSELHQDTNPEESGTLHHLRHQRLRPQMQGIQTRGNTNCLKN